MSGAAPAATDPGTTPAPGATPPAATPPAATPPAATPPAGNPDFRSTIPEAYREKTYLRDVKGPEDVFKMLDNAQSLIGKQGKGIPAPDAPKEDWEKFYSTLGRPETPDKYEFERAEGVEGNPEADKVVKQIFHKAGLSGTQAKQVAKEYEALIAQTIEAQNQQLETEFNQMTTEVFGDKAPEALRHSQALLDRLTPAAAKKYLPELGNKAATVLAAVLQEVNRVYIKEDPTRLSGNNAPAGGAVTEDQIRAEGQKLMADPAYNDPFHANHKTIRDQVAALYAKIPSKK